MEDRSHLITSQPKGLTISNAADQEEPSQVSSCHPLACCMQSVCCPLTLGVTLISGIFSLPPQREVIMFRYGKYERTIKEPGLHYSNIFGREMRHVSTQIQSMDLRGATVLDHSGNPLIVAAIVVFQYVNSYRATVRVANAASYLATQAESVLKNVVAEFPYEPPADHAPSLRTHAHQVNQRLVESLQERVNVAGVKVHSFDIKEISYAPVIAAAMLKRQQAHAIVQARQTIVEGAVEIASSAVEQLRTKGIELEPAESTRLVSNLLTVICSEAEVQPTLPLSSP